MLLNSTKRVSIKAAEAYKADSSAHTAGESESVMRWNFIGSQRNFDSAQCAIRQSARSTEVLDKKCFTSCDGERLLIYRISSANMASKRGAAEHANVVPALTRRVCSRAAAPARAVPVLPGHVRLLLRRAVQADVRGERAADYWRTSEGTGPAAARAPPHGLGQLGEWWIEVVITLNLLMWIHHVEITQRVWKMMAIN